MQSTRYSFRILIKAHINLNKFKDQDNLRKRGQAYHIHYYRITQKCNTLNITILY